jgi:hypothetical protein
LWCNEQGRTTNVPGRYSQDYIKQCVHIILSIPGARFCFVLTAVLLPPDY